MELVREKWKNKKRENWQLSMGLKCLVCSLCHNCSPSRKFYSLQLLFSLAPVSSLVCRHHSAGWLRLFSSLLWATCGIHASSLGWILVRQMHFYIWKQALSHVWMPLQYVSVPYSFNDYITCTKFWSVFYWVCPHCFDWVQVWAAWELL